MSAALGDKVDTNFDEKTLLKEIKELAVEKQSNLVNTVALMSKRWRGSPVCGESDIGAIN